MTPVRLRSVPVSDVDPYRDVLKGLPADIFDIAACVAVLKIKEERWDPTLIVRPVAGAWGTFCNLSGGHYEGTGRRRSALLKQRPILKDRHGRSIYPAILVPDMSDGLPDDVHPVGFCGPTGFLGSAYNTLDDFWDEAARRQRGDQYFATLVAVNRGEYVVEAHGWLAKR